jgi:hypothetical protein
MTSRFAPLGAFLSILALLGWLSLSSPREPVPATPTASADLGPVDQEDEEQEGQEGQEREDQVGAMGSAVPCAVPLAWRIDRVDGRFGITAAQARVAVQRAAALWEGAVDRRLFAEDPAGGFAIRFVYDDRQATAQERGRLVEEIEEVDRSLETGRKELEELSKGYAQLMAQYEQDLQDFERRASEHNSTVRDWNRRGGAPDSVLEELRSIGDELEVRRRGLRDQGSEIRAFRQSFQEREDRFNREVGEQRQKGEALTRAFPAERVESAQYREAVRTRNGRVVQVNREINVYRFDNPNDLELVVAHELGHALGLGHAPVTGAVMSEEYGRPSASGANHEIQPGDLSLLWSRCPQLTRD